MTEWIKRFKESDDWREFQDYLAQFDWDEMARQHHGHLIVSPKETQESK